MNTHFLSSFLCALAPLRDLIFPLFVFSLWLSFFVPGACPREGGDVLCGEISLFIFLLFNSNFDPLCPASVLHELSGNSRLIGAGWQKLSVLIPCKSVSNKIWRKKGSIKNILFMQNKPNFRKTKMNATHYLTNSYAEKPKPRSTTKTNPIEPDFSQSSFKIGNYSPTFFLLLLFLPSILSASSWLEGGHLPSFCSSFKFSSSFISTIVRHLGNLLQPRN